MLTRNERVMVEAIKDCPLIEKRLFDGHSDHTIRVSKDKTFAHDVALSLQGYFNRRNKVDKS